MSIVFTDEVIVSVTSFIAALRARNDSEVTHQLKDLQVGNSTTKVLRKYIRSSSGLSSPTRNILTSAVSNSLRAFSRVKTWPCEFVM